MTQAELFITIGYLANPIRETRIEVELPLKDRTRFESDYATRTVNFPLPLTSNTTPYYVWPEGADKWGIETRAYFNSNENLPNFLFDMLEPRKEQNRPGYENWERRISLKKIVYELFRHGFVLGGLQNVLRIRSFIPNQFNNEFNTGFNL